MKFFSVNEYVGYHV